MATATREEKEVSVIFQEYYTLKDAARVLNMKWRTLGDQIRRGEVEAMKVANAWLLHVDEVERLLEKQVP